jgi:PEP-CTERM motif
LAAVCGGAAVASAGPYSPAPPAAGSDAIAATDPRISEWASGYQNYVEGSPINATFANPAEALGPFQNSTVDVTELGDGGQITYTFAKPIAASASGPDFVVFGNSFEAPYEKLAYVEVSVDGQTWLRMPNHDLTPSPVGTFGLTDPTNIDGLAGKYQLGYGVGFSLSEVGLTTADYVRIVDVIGNGSDKDSSGNPIYDPTPNSDGFNVAGVGVLSVVPEPSSIVLLLIGLGALAITWWRSVRTRPGIAVNG